MCGRTACTLGPEEIVQACTYRDRKGKKRRPAWVDAPDGRQYRSSCNVAPSTHTPVLVSSKHVQDHGIVYSMEDQNAGDCKEGAWSEPSSCDRVLMPMKWGLTPPWHQGDPYKVPYETNNCRSEGMLEKKTYKIPLQKGNRCVVLADGFYEWKTTKEGKQPYFFYFPQPDGVRMPGDRKVKTETDDDFKLQDKSCKKERGGSDETNSNSIVKKEIKADLCSQWPLKREIKDFDEPDGFKVPRLDVSPDVENKGKYLTEYKDPVSNVGGGVKSCKFEKNTSDEDKLKLKDSLKDFKASSESEKQIKEGIQKEGREDERPEEDWDGWKPLTMAAVFDVWKPNNSSPPLFSYSVITVPSSKDMDWCHHRMPAILSTEEEIQDWLDYSNIPLNKAVSLIKPQQCLTFHPVSKAMNNSRYNSPDCMKPVELGKVKPSPSSNLMMNWLKKASPVKKEKV